MLRERKRIEEAYHGELGHTHVEGLNKVKGFGGLGFPITKI